jgi:hypothetical protein
VANKDRAAVENGLSDILGNVIQSDRRRAGRGEEPPGATPAYDAVTSPSETDEDRNKTIRQCDNKAIVQTEGVVKEPVSAAAPRKRRAEPKDEATALQRRVAEAQALAHSPTTTVTLRIPHAPNDWLDEYVHGSWPEKVKQQQLVTEALQLLFAQRGRPKEEVLPTSLLPEDD